MAISQDDLKIKLANYSELQLQRQHDQVPLPASLKGPAFTTLEVCKFACLDTELLKEHFPQTFGEFVQNMNCTLFVSVSSLG